MKISRSARIGLAWFIWAGVAGMLAYRGLVPHFSNIGSTGGQAMALLLGVVVGSVKGYFVLSRSAERTAKFIARRPDQDWFWFCFHPVLYVLIPLMILFGVVLRHYCQDSAPAVVVGVYVGIAAALLVGLRGFRRSALEDTPGSTGPA